MRIVSLLIGTTLVGCSVQGGHVTTNLKLATHVAGPGSASSGLSASSVGASTVAGLTSLKYSIRQIGICNNANIHGTGFDLGDHCVALYNGPSDSFFDSQPLDPSTIDYGKQADHARSTDAGFLDLMDPSALATLNADVTIASDDVQTYKYGYIYWHYPIKVNATVFDGSGQPILYTHDGTTAGSAMSAPTTTASTSLTQGPATEAVVALPNGGAWFAFQSPFAITDDDIKQKRNFVLDLTFNPDGIIQGMTAPGATNGPPLVDAAGDTIEVPMLNLAPVVHRSTEAVVKESYLASIDSNMGFFDLRLELYSIDGDPMRTIYGVDTHALVNAMSQGPALGIAQPAFLRQNTDGTIDFLDYQHNPAIAGFKRGSMMGDTTTATIPCGGMGMCSNGPVTFTLRSVATLQ